MLAALPLWAAPAGAQTAPRIKARLVSLDGNTMTVQPDGDSTTMKIGIRPATRILKEEQKALGDLHEGDYVGATLNKSAGGFAAQEVHVFPAALKNSGEGLYPATPGSSYFILNGTVTGVGPSSLSVKFRGASGAGASCSGRASLDPLQGCQGSATVAVANGTPVLALVASDKNALTVGQLLAISLLAGPDGRPVSPGITIENVATPEVPLPPAANDKPSTQPAGSSTTRPTSRPGRPQSNRP